VESSRISKGKMLHGLSISSAPAILAVWWQLVDRSNRAVVVEIGWTHSMEKSGEQNPWREGTSMARGTRQEAAAFFP